MVSKSDYSARASRCRDYLPALRSLFLAVVCTGVLAGCSSATRDGVQIVDRNASGSRSAPLTAGQYRVQRGDTLYSIAFRFGWDWKALAARNNIPAPYLIKPGQIIRFDSKPAMAAQQAVVVKAPAPQPVVPATVRAQKTYPSVVVSSPAPAPTSVATPKPVAVPKPILTQVKLSSSGWAWPAQGVVISKFSSNGSLNKGIDIAGELGQPVLSAQDGTVVYAGSGLRGYGELVIIKHSDIYVSAYGHNRSLKVREGQKVKAGQVIADMGSTGTDRVKLHFEIRRQGKPVDPLQYLPSK